MHNFGTPMSSNHFCGQGKDNCAYKSICANTVNKNFGLLERHVMHARHSCDDLSENSSDELGNNFVMI